jgi:diguanylate cyclase (GGDEF)-like protein/PAS domain S-box-containing protein
MPYQANANLSALIESTEDLIWSVDLDYRLIAFNSAFQKHFEDTFYVRPVAGMCPQELIPKERVSRLPPLYDRARSEGSFRVEFPLADGRTLELSLNPIVSDGEITGISVFGKDITERMSAESALKQTEKKYRAIFDDALEGIFQASLDSKLLAANPAIARILGYNSPQELLSSVQSVKQDVWFDPKERSTYLQLAQEKVGGIVLGYECRLKRKDESVVWVSLNSRIVCSSDGKPLYNEGFLFDITDRKQAEESLRQSGDFLKEAQKFGNLGCYALDIPSGVWTSSDALDEIFGIYGNYVRTVEGWTALIHPHDRAMMADYFQNEVVGQRRDFDKEYRIVRISDQAERWVHGTGRLEFSAQGQPLKMHGIIKDITERKLSEMHLRDSVEHYRAIFHTAPDSVTIARLDDGMIIDANQAFLESTGYERNEVIGHTTVQLGLWVNAADRKNMVESVLCNAQCRDFEVQSRRKNGQTFWMRLSSSLIEIAGSKCILTFARDISESKAAEQHLAEAASALRASEVRYRTVFRMNIDAVDICHLEDGKYIDVNDAFVVCTGFARDEVIGRTALELGIWANPTDRNQLVEIIRRDGSCRSLEAPYHTKGGTLRWALLSVSAIELDGVPCILSVTRDITEAKAAEQRLATSAEALRISEARYRNVFQTSLDCIVLSSLNDGKLIDVNQAYLDLMGFEYDEVIGQTSEGLDLWENREIRHGLTEMVRRDTKFRDITARIKKKNGELFWALLSASLIELDGIPHLLWVMRDISAAKAAEDQIRDLAFYDTLTHLPNRRLLMERLRQSLTAGSRTQRKRALLFVDLDNFKILNDTLGHQTGDLMLQEVAARLTSCIRETDTVARLGGDEFIVMLEDLSDVPEEAAAQAEIVGEKILAAVNRPFWLSGRECLSTSSIGITVFGNKRESTDDVLQQADIAMYQAKAAGRNTLRFFAPALQAAVNARAALEEDIRQAIKTSQFVLYYQPQLDSIGLFGAEALIRWNHPRRGLLFPGEFISLAEETGLILPLGDWVLENACAQVAAWAGRTDTANISIAVNISARQFRQPSFVDKVLAALERTGANPQNIKLELTESMLVENIEDVIAKMTELKSHGLKFSLDDFGTGYSSLAYLKRLPLDQLKIDSSFVRDILLDVGSRAIAQSVISLGRALGLSVIAECVETEDQRDLLCRLGCHAFQGFLFSRALPLDLFEKQWLCSSEFTVPISG